ncbi:MAG: hypothetical protein ACM3SW_12685 [Actinomycetota bacterium]
MAGEALLAVRDATPPARRHFWVEISGGKSLIRRADLNKTGTFGELQALAAYLKADPLRTIALVSTSLHLRRIQFCCSRIPFFRDKDILLWAAPAGHCSIDRDQWWKNGAGRRYLLSEYIKLAGYNFLYRYPPLAKLGWLKVFGR